ncbi:MAG: NBR1-Ig-like domain-containing protein [Chloroflexota bacterium]
MKASHSLVILLIASLLVACGSRTGATPTVDVNAMYTAAAGTFVAEITQTAAAFTPTPQPTATDMPTADAAPSNPDATDTPPAPTAEAVCDDAVFVRDATIPDGYDQLTPGQEFTKTWVLKNTGTCTWTADYQIVYGYGELMNGKKANRIGVEVPPQFEVELSVTLVAPAISGEYTGVWRMANAAGSPFGEFFSVSIKIP